MFKVFRVFQGFGRFRASRAYFRVKTVPDLSVEGCRFNFGGSGIMAGYCPDTVTA